jgi:hypothetical protein
LGILNKDLIKKVDRLKDILSDCCYGFLTNKICIVLTKPKVVVDSEWRLHNEQGMALEWKDGMGEYFLYGVKFEKELWEKIVQKKITKEEIFALNNQEQKSVALRLYGYNNLIKDAKIIHSEGIIQNGTVQTYQVLEIDLGDDDVPARFVKVINWSEPKEYILRVDPRIELTKTCRGAVAWTFGLKSEKELKFMVEPT